MDNKYSFETQVEIENILKEIQTFKKFFSINIEYYIDGVKLKNILKKYIT